MDSCLDGAEIKVLCMTNTGRLQSGIHHTQTGDLQSHKNGVQVPPALTLTARSSQLVRPHPATPIDGIPCCATLLA